LRLRALEQVASTWSTTSPERQQNLARGLFEYIVYDLDVQRIVDFKLKAWADRFLMLRASLYPEVGPDGEILAEKHPCPDDQDMGNPVPHRGLLTISLPLLEDADSCIAALIYLSETLSSKPISGRTPTKTERNAEIIQSLYQRRNRAPPGPDIQHL
jgi:hypothetical protein